MESQPHSSSSPSPTTSSFPSPTNTADSERLDDAAATGASVSVKGCRKEISHKRELDRSPMMQPRPASPVAKTLEEHQHQDQDQQQKADADDERPHAPVAKALLRQTSSVVSEGEETHEHEMDTKPSPSGNAKSSSSMITNLLSSGKFPPPPHSPRQRNHNQRLSMSPPTILGLLSSPLPSVPAAPPSTPYTPCHDGLMPSASLTAAAVAVNNARHPPLPIPMPGASSPLLNSSYTLNHRPTSPPLHAHDGQPPNIPPISPGSLPAQRLGTPAPNDPHNNALLNQALHETMEREKARIASLSQHENENYTSIEEYKHALSRERRHSTSYAMELTHYKFLIKYTSCNIHSAAEINEEARINSLIKNINCMKRDMNEDKCRVVMELEREEERIINGLVLRLEEVTREKLMLERQIGSVRGGSAGPGGFGGAVGFGGNGVRLGGAMDEDEARLHARLEQMMQHQEEQGRQQHGVSNNIAQDRLAGGVGIPSMHQQHSSTAEEAMATMPTSGIIGSELLVDTDADENNEMEEDSEEEEEEEEEDVDEDILGGRYHDPEMEEELAKLLNMKDSS